MSITLMSTIKGSLLEGFFPEGWDLEKLDALCGRKPETIAKAEKWWSKKFEAVPCASLADFDMMMGHEIAWEIAQAKEAKKQILFILPVGPMGMYRWAVYFLKEWNVDCRHVHGFNMDEWSDAKGATLPAKDPGAFQNAMEQAFYGPLGKLSVPKGQRHFATKAELPKYADAIAALRAKGGRLVTVYGIGRACHIAFWEPHFADEFETVEEWKKQPCRLGARLHPFTIEQNALTSFRSNWSLIPCYANTIGPGIIFQSDYCIGGADGVFSRGMQWQGLTIWMTLRYGPDKAVTSSFIPTLPGKLFFMRELAGPLTADTN